MNKYASMLLSALAILVPAISADASAAIGIFVAHNPTLSMALVSAGWVVFHMLPSSIQGEVTGSSIPKV